MLLQQGRNSLYEPQAIGYTIVPGTLKALCRQRVRWARGMFDGLRSVAPWKQASFYGGYFESVNVSIIFLDLAYVFVFLPGIVLFFLGFDWLVGWMTLLTLPAFFIARQALIAFKSACPASQSGTACLVLLALRWFFRPFSLPARFSGIFRPSFQNG